MKKFLVVLAIVSGIAWSAGFDDAFSEGATDNSTAPTQAVSATFSGESQTCKDILDKDPANGGAKTPPPNPAIEGNIVVLLTEQIETKGGNTPCSKVIECLRARIKNNPANKNTSATMRELAEIFALKRDYSQCIIAGKTGLDLLNNYARLVYQWIAGIVGAICVLVIILSGIQISVGGLSPEEVGTAKDRITHSLIGLAVLFLSAFILYSINPIFFS